jgi:hypothetical protein
MCRSIIESGAQFRFRELRSLGWEGHLFISHIQSRDLLAPFLKNGNLYKAREDAPHGINNCR